MGNSPGGIKNYEISKDKILGKGSFGVVYKGRNLSTGLDVAVKQLTVSSDMERSMVMKEVKNFEHIIPHKHILKMLDFSYAENALWIVMEYCDKGDLTAYMKKYAPNIDKQVKIMHQCASAVEHMHSLKTPIIHRDIKPDNILFKTEGKSDVAKLSDFGLSRILDEQDTISKIRMDSIVGARYFMAPELFAREKYTHTVDTFALAMVFLAMINYKTADEQLIPLSATCLQSGSDKIITVGHEMYEANLAKSRHPVVVQVSPIDNPKMKSIKKMIIEMSAPVPGTRMPLKQVLKEIEIISVGETTKGMAGHLSASKIFKSNLDVTMTRASFDPDDLRITHDKSSGYGGSGEMSKATGASGGASSGGSIPKKVEEDREVTAEEEPDIGYMLMRQMIEDHLKKKRAEQLKEKKAREEAETLAAALPLLMLLKLMESDSDNAQNFQIGDKVVVEREINKARQLQVNYGGWSDKMKKYLGEEGTVKEIRDGRISVVFPDGQKLMWNAHLLGKIDEKHTSRSGGLKDSKFKMNDVVRIKVTADQLQALQKKGSAGWRDKMKNAIGIRGAVHQIHSDGDVLVEFMNGDKWWMSPDALEVVDMSSIEIEAGDTVVVIDDRKMAQKLQKGHGDWVDGMEKCLGLSGIVRKVGGNQRAVVEVNNTKYIWNTACLKLICKSEEMILVMLKKHLLDE